MKDYTKTLLIICAILLALLFFMIIKLYTELRDKEEKQNHPIGKNYKLLESVTDDRGLTSVVFIDEKKDTVALDFLTPKEFDSLFTQKN